MLYFQAAASRRSRPSASRKCGLAPVGQQRRLLLGDVLVGRQYPGPALNLYSSGKPILGISLQTVAVRPVAHRQASARPKVLGALDDVRGQPA